MSNVKTTLRQWSSTESANQPQGGTTIGSTLDDDLRAIQQVVRQFLADQSATVAPSAGVADLTTATGRWVPVSGSSTVTGFGTESAGVWYLVTLTGSPTINNGNISTPGGVTIVGAVGDMFVADSQGSGVWRIHSYTRSVAIPYPSVLVAEVASTSGTSIDFTGIPAWAKKITVNFIGVSTSGTDSILFQLGDSGGAEATGYLGACSALTATAVSTSNFTTGIGLTNGSAANVYHGAVVFTLDSATNFTWSAHGVFALSSSATTLTTAGSKSTSAQTDRIRVTTTGGTDTFDAGTISIQYE